MHHTVAVRRPTPLLTACAAGLLLLAACADDGRTLADVRPGQTTTTTALPAISGTDGGTFTLRTDVVDDGGELPVTFTCFGERTSPPLRWSGVPLGTSSLALVVRDRDADGYVHWIVTGIDPSVQAFGDGGLPEGAAEQVNSTGAIGWDPPCPPDDGGRHIYDVVLHALDQPVDIDPELPADEAAAVVEAASVNEAALALTVTPPAPGIGSTEP